MKSESATKSTMTGIPSSCRNLYHMEASPAPAATLTIEVTINVGRSTIHSPGVHWLQYGCLLCSVKYFATLRTPATMPLAGSVDCHFPFSTGPPATCHARHPPAIDATFVYPIFCRLSAASAERKPPPQ